MHKHHESGEAVSAPEPVRKAINLVEEFFGLTLADGAYYPFRDDRRHDDGDHFLGYLMSPTGRALDGYTFIHRRRDGWVLVKGDKGNPWEDALQIAVDNFVNNPKGGYGVLGDWRPTADKLNADR